MASEIEKTENIIVKKSNIHNKGVFARREIKKGTLVTEYVGEHISKQESERRLNLPIEKYPGLSGLGAVYIFDLNEKYDIDGDVKYNPAKYINHSCNPNCEVEITDDQINIKAIKEIGLGEEITFNYGYGLEKEDTMEDLEGFECYCSSDKCIGYMLGEDYWPLLKKLLDKEKNQSSKTQ